MAQAEVNNLMETRLVDYKHRLILHLKQEEVDLFSVCEQVFALLHFLKRIIEKDWPEHKHQDNLCQCKSTVQSVFPWIVPLEVEVSDRLSFHQVTDFYINGGECWMKTTQKKYFLALISEIFFRPKRK